MYLHSYGCKPLKNKDETSAICILEPFSLLLKDLRYRNTILIKNFWSTCQGKSQEEGKGKTIKYWKDDW